MGNRVLWLSLSAALCISASIGNHAAIAQLGRGPLDHIVTVKLQRGALSLPPGTTTTTPANVEMASPNLASMLNTIGARSITKAFPNFKLADTLGVARTGEIVRLNDYSNYYEIELAPETDRATAIQGLRSLEEVDFAIGNEGITYWGAPVYPSDPLFKNQTQWGMWKPEFGGTDVDVDAAEAWSVTQGRSDCAVCRIGIIDSGVDNSNPEFTGRVFGDTSVDTTQVGECPDHGYMVAGVAAAAGNNTDGIAGMSWHSGIKNLNIGTSATTSNIVGAIQRSYQSPRVGVINMSLTLATGCQDCNIPLVQDELTSAYNMNLVTVACTGNTGGNDQLYPAANKQGVIAVGASDKFDGRWPMSTYGNHIDVIAPGVDIWSTARTGYKSCDGTSFASAAVAGLASLLFATDTTLYNDDVQNIIQLSTDDKLSPGWDGFTGWGRINAGKAVRLAKAPNVFLRGTTTGNQRIQDTAYNTFILEPGFSSTHIYFVRRFEIRAPVSFPTDTFQSTPFVWGRGVGTKGFSTENPIFGAGWCDTVPGTVWQNGATLRTYVYEVMLDQSHTTPIDTIPQGIDLGNPASVTLNWSALEVRSKVDLTQSFYVPQRGSVGTPIEGTSATSFFRACPNNDGGTSLANNARIKVVVKNSAGVGIPGVLASDIFVLLNGGTPVQEFIGDGADSVVANGFYNSVPLCPNVRALEADAPTNASGETYVTFTGSTPENPGIGVRNPNRKWGHYDTELPVYVLGIRLQGRITSGSPNGTYALQIKNYDFRGGVGTAPNLGEVVASDDHAWISNNLNKTPADNPINWWADYDNSGSISSSDYSQFTQHILHDCDTPNNP